MDKDYSSAPSQLHDHYVASPDRYNGPSLFRRTGKSGLKLPLICLGTWQNFGGVDSFEAGRKMLLKAFDLGVTHFDYGNNYGRPPGSAEENFGLVLKKDLHRYRDELIISTKAGYDMWPGPYGEWGSKKYLVASLNQSLKRLKLDYVDIFYSHRFDPETPLEETCGALDLIVRQGKALYIGISSYDPLQTQKALEILIRLGTPCLVHQSSYSMFNRWTEKELIPLLDTHGVGFMAFSPLAQGLLSNKYVDGKIVPGSRAAMDKSSFSHSKITPEMTAKLQGLNKIAKERGQTLSQMALAWVLKDPRVTCAVIGASSIQQIEENVNSQLNLSFTKEELSQIDTFAVDIKGINLW